MQIRKIAHKDFFNATVVTPAMVVQIAKALGMSEEAITKLQAQKLAKASGGKGGRSNGAADLPDGKLRTVVATKLANKNDLVDGWSQESFFEMEFHGPDFPDEQPEPDINAAGANNARKQRASAKPGNVGGVQQKGHYVVVNCKGLKCTAESDPEKFNLWQHVWNSKTFEEYYANAPKKAVTRTQRIITAASEMAWAIKSGWVRPATEEEVAARNAQ